MVDTAIFNLSMKSLIKIDDEEKFDMHDHLRDMGRTIAEMEKEGTRLWEPKHLSILYYNNNFSHLQINVSSPQRLEFLYSLDLRYLHLQDVHIEGMAKDTLAMLPQSLLQHLDLGGCRGLNILPDSLGNLSQLQHLDLGGCRGLNILPYSLGNLSQLQHLDLGGCRGLNTLPDILGNLSQLQHLDLSFCQRLNILPDTIGNLSQLRYLNLLGSGIDHRPDRIGRLSYYILSGVYALPDC
ncbi:receptor-like protein 49 [Cryptomeria japonica]|uniref:receptor-like protein 49 n=1 Tax=Cryptomeria japonica TaxID=3369 RepID=UPI0027DA9CC0|nr:receptor-like protein 49 [Cryptomeria japonica]